MIQRYPAWHPYSWPLSLKFFVGFALGLAVLTLPALLFVRDGVIGITEARARTFIEDTGARQIVTINTTLNDARTAMNTFIAAPANARQLEGLLLADVRASGLLPTTPTNANEVGQVLQRTLVSSAAALFDNVRLLDRSGNALSFASFTTAGVPNNADESRSAAFVNASAAAERGQDLVLSVTQIGVPVIEYVQVLRWRDNTVIGYLVGRVSNARVFINTIRLTPLLENFFAESFITDGRDVVLAPLTDSGNQLAALNTPLIGRALSGRAGYEQFTDSTGERFAAYYAPIADTPLALIVEVSFGAIEQASFQFFQVRVFTILVGVGALNVVMALLFSQLIVPSLARMRRALRALGNGNYDEPLPDLRRGDEIGTLAGTLDSARAQVRSTVDELETRLEQRTRDITATQEISRTAATQLDLQRLMDQVVNLITERFPSIYHAQIFLLDEDENFAVLRASTGEPGQQLLARGHRLAVGSVSVIGQVAQQARVIIARDTAVSEVHRRNEFLPDTRAELAVPLRIGDRVIGALDVQSKQNDAFTEQDTIVLQTMADQVAVAIQNARLYTESLRRVTEIEDINRRETGRVWQQYMRDQRASALTYEAGADIVLNGGAEALSQLRQAAITSGSVVMGARTERNTIPLAVPVQLRGQTLGAVEWEIPAGSMSDDKLELARELANRLALSLDNARLFQESQRAFERERLVNEIAAKISAQTSIDEILQTAVREVGQALRSPAVSIRLNERHQNGNGNGA